jgi:HEAT repeat protein
VNDTHAVFDRMVRQIDTLTGVPHDSVPGLGASGDLSLVPKAEAALRRFLDEGNAYGRDAMADILARLQATEAFPAVLRASARDLDDDQDSLTSTLFEIIETDPQACRPTMLAFARDPDPSLRCAGLWALHLAAQPADLDLLETALTDPVLEVRSAALSTIASFEADQRAFTLLLQALYTPDLGLRRQAVNELGARPEALPHLRALSDDPELRDNVAWALRRG